MKMNFKKINTIICTIIIILYPMLTMNEKVQPFGLAIYFTKSLFIYLGLNLYINNINKKDDN